VKISETFASTSKYFKHSDLAGKEVRKRISHVGEEEMGLTNDRKPVVYFKGEQKAFVLNKTNARTLAMAFGDDTLAWGDREIFLRPTTVDYRGQPTATIRVRPVLENGAGDVPSDDIPLAPEWRG
jgi:fructose/tagatose bisphosphate aldolase